MVQETHRLLMDGAVTDDRQPLRGGQFRTHSCSAGYSCSTSHEYLAPALVPETTAEKVDKYNGAVQHGADVVKRAADLQYHLIHNVQPFADGKWALGSIACCLCYHGRSGTISTSALEWAQGNQEAPSACGAAQITAE